jgi:hypothetical protein
MERYLTKGQFEPEELVDLKRIFDDITSQPWFEQSEDAKEGFAKYLFESFRAVTIDPEKHRPVIEASARTFYSRDDAAKDRGTIPCPPRSRSRKNGRSDMPNSAWKTPVEIDLGMVGTHTVSGPFDALIYLTDRWPNRSGARFLKASIACKAAVEGRVEAEAARQEFIAAAQEVRLLQH